MKETKRLKVLQEAMRREVTVAEAAITLEMSERQTWRLLAQVKEQGAAGIVHGNRGRENHRHIESKIEAKILKLRQEKYLGFNDRHFTEELFEQEAITIGRESVRKILRRHGVAAPRVVKRRKHRRRRDPRERFGEMLQADASPHDWLEGRGPKLSFVHYVDDATNWEWADFFEAETTLAYMTIFERIVRKYGLPRSLYVDKHSVFRVNREQTQEEQLTGQRPLTTFGRAMTELGVRLIYADSPQAKGRVERRGGFHQDRLVSELRLAGAKTIEEARIVLKAHLIKINRKFVRQAAENGLAFLPIPRGVDIKQVLCWKEQRTVSNDNIVSVNGRRYQLDPSPSRSSWAKCKVMVHVCLDGSLYVFNKGERIAYFRQAEVDWNDLPMDPQISSANSRHSPLLTNSLGR